MPKQIMVKAAPLADPALAGLARVVKEGTLRRYITEDPEGVLVPLTGYYARKLAQKELIVAEPQAPAVEADGLVTSADEEEDR